MWEIFSYIQTPFEGMTSPEVRRKKENMLFGCTIPFSHSCKGLPAELDFLFMRKL